MRSVVETCFWVRRCKLQRGLQAWDAYEEPDIPESPNRLHVSLVFRRSFILNVVLPRHDPSKRWWQEVLLPQALRFIARRLQPLSFIRAAVPTYLGFHRACHKHY